jgi:hypothetical protein
LHLMMDLDPRVVSGVLGELKSLVAPARRDEQVVAANAPAPERIVTPIDNKIVTAPAPAQRLSAGWLPRTNTVTPDVTCTNCWGFTQSLGAERPDSWPDSWMR